MYFHNFSFKHQIFFINLTSLIFSKSQKNGREGHTEKGDTKRGGSLREGGETERGHSEREVARHKKIVGEGWKQTETRQKGICQ